MADSAAGTASAPREPVLREELLARAERDQDARQAHSDAVDRGERDWSPVAAVDADNLAFLAPLLEQRGMSPRNCREHPVPARASSLRDPWDGY